MLLLYRHQVLQSDQIMSTTDLHANGYEWATITFASPIGGAHNTMSCFIWNNNYDFNGFHWDRLKNMDIEFKTDNDDVVLLYNTQSDNNFDPVDDLHKRQQ